MNDENRIWIVYYTEYDLVHRKERHTKFYTFLSLKEALKCAEYIAGAIRANWQGQKTIGAPGDYFNYHTADVGYSVRLNEQERFYKTVEEWKDFEAKNLLY